MAQNLKYVNLKYAIDMDTSGCIHLKSNNIKRSKWCYLIHLRRFHFDLLVSNLISIFKFIFWKNKFKSLKKIER